MSSSSKMLLNFLNMQLVIGIKLLKNKNKRVVEAYLCEVMS
jgi:hypothetical protein